MTKDRRSAVSKALGEVLDAAHSPRGQRDEKALCEAVINALWVIGHEPHPKPEHVAFLTGFAVALLTDYAVMLKDDRVEVTEVQAD